MPTTKPTVLVTLEPRESRVLQQMAKRYGLTRPQMLRQLLRAAASREYGYVNWGEIGAAER